MGRDTNVEKNSREKEGPCAVVIPWPHCWWWCWYIMMVVWRGSALGYRACTQNLISEKRNKGQLTTEPSLLMLPHHPCATAIKLPIMLPIVLLPAVSQLSCLSCCGCAAAVGRVGLGGLVVQQSGAEWTRLMLHPAGTWQLDLTCLTLSLWKRWVTCLHLVHALRYHWDLAMEDSSNCGVSAMVRIASGHHVLDIKHLLSRLGYCDSTDCWLPCAVSGAKPVRKKCRRRKGTVEWMNNQMSTTQGHSTNPLTASFCRSGLSWPGKHRQVLYRRVRKKLWVV